MNPRLLLGWRLTTAEILYRLPDAPSILQTFVLQQLDLAPEFPAVLRFCRWWQDNLAGPIVQVRIGAHRIISPEEIRTASAEFRLN